MLNIAFNANPNQYRIFIKYALETCESFSLIFEKDYIDSTQYIFEEIYYTICEFVLERKSICIHPDTGTNFLDSDIIYFKCDKKTKDILLVANSVFDWNGKNLPEELCFYRNSKKWFTFISHEKYLFIHNETKEDIDFFKSQQIKY